MINIKKRDMKFVDTHAHLSSEQFINDISDVILRSREAGITQILMPDVGIDGREELLALCERYRGYLRPMVGVHPTTLNEEGVDAVRELDEVESLLREMPRGYFCGVGEIGLDYYHSREHVEAQKMVFVRQCELALEYDLPVNIHTREAWGDMCELLEGFKGRGLRGVMHAFCDSEESYRRIKACGDFLFAIGGVVTFKRSQVADVVREMSLGDLLLETDSPYLTPHPYRGRRNDPSYIPVIGEKVAELQGVSLEEVSRVTTANYARLFGTDGASAN